MSAVNRRAWTPSAADVAKAAATLARYGNDIHVAYGWITGALASIDEPYMTPARAVRQARAMAQAMENIRAKERAA